MKPLELKNQRFGRLTVVERCERQCNKLSWLCQCDCGGFSKVPGAALKSGNTKSCGCMVADRIGAMRRSHGKSRTAEYRAWSAVKTRCYNAAFAQTDDYGARGIKMDARWRDSFEAFLSDMGPRPSPRHSIDRDDVNGNYEPSNCRWATQVEQVNNARSNVRITFGGETMTASQWAKRLGIKPATVRDRARKDMPVETVLYAGSLKSIGR